MKDQDIQKATTATEEELKSLVYHRSSEVISRILHNKNLTEDLVLIIANRKNIDPKILELLAHNERWKDRYNIKLALCKNPKTPQKLSISLLKFLKIFDLAELTRNNIIPATLRMKIEANIGERLPAMPLGIKITLAKRASSNVLMRLIEEGLKEVVEVCLDSPYLTEADIYKIISMEKTSPQVIRMIAAHRKWSCRYYVRWALILNRHAPLACVVNFLKDMKKSDLKELYNAPNTPSGTKPFIYRELLEREEEINLSSL